MLNHESFMEGIKSKVHPVFNLSNIYINHVSYSRVIMNLLGPIRILKKTWSRTYIRTYMDLHGFAWQSHSTCSGGND